MNKNDAKKDFLKSYRNDCLKIKTLEEQKESIIELMISAKSQKINDMPCSCTHSDLSDYIVKLEKIINEIDNKKAECLAHKIAIESAILQLNDGTECMVLRKRYLLLLHDYKYQSWDKISEDMGYSLKHIHRFHGSALQNLNIGGGA